jgi:ribonucleoside-diphosphate reductase alpha subunit
MLQALNGFLHVIPLLMSGLFTVAINLRSHQTTAISLGIEFSSISINTNMGSEARNNKLSSNLKLKPFVMTENEIENQISLENHKSNQRSVNDQNIYVTKRDGRREIFDSNKLLRRLEGLMSFHNHTLKHVNVSNLCDTIVRGMYDGVTTTEIDTLAAESAASLCTQHFEYATLAARIAITHNHKVTPSTFSNAMKLLYRKNNSVVQHENMNNQNKKYEDRLNVRSFLHPDLIDIIERRGDIIDSRINHDRDLDMTYFGFKTLERAYLLRSSSNNNSDVIIERPQYLLMRVALGIHCTGHNNDLHRNLQDENKRLDAAFETYEYMSRGIFTHASPTLFHAGTIYPQLASCFLVQMREDSISGIYDTLKQCAVISKSAGGIGLSVHNIRARGTPIHGTRGVSNGLVPMLRVFDVTSRYVDQGGGKRPGAFAIYLEPWHADVLDVLNLKKNHGKEEQRARDLFYGLWIPDLFMKRVQEDSMWSLMCPHQCPGLSDCYGSTFESLYEKYEHEGLYARQIRARELWYAILESQIETGTPYMLYKDACNAKSNQQNLGTIQCSNLCTEIIQFTSRDEIAVCNLASLCLSKFVVSDRGPFGSVNPYSSSNRAYFDHEALHHAAKIVTRNLNKIIDINHYPMVESRSSNLSHRPIGIGVSGLADAFVRLGLPFTSTAAQQLNAAIFETIYHAALEASADLAEEKGSYDSFQGSPASRGRLQFDLWHNDSATLEEVDRQTPSHQYENRRLRCIHIDDNSPPYTFQLYPSFAKLNGYDWIHMRNRIKRSGLRNSLLLAPMPTASTSQILGVNECFEPFSSNLYIRRVKAGEFIVANPHLLQDLTDNGLWTSSIRNQVMRDGGSIQNVASIPPRIKELYKTVWELGMKQVVDMAADRGKYDCSLFEVDFLL